jgi:hypothetical protein
VIFVDDVIISHQIVLPIFNILYQGIYILVIGRVLEDHPMKYFTLIAKKPSSLHQNCSHGIPTCICLYFDGLMKVGNARIGA